MCITCGEGGGGERWTEKPKFGPGAEGLLLRLQLAVRQRGSANFLLRFFPFYSLCLSQKGKRKESAALLKQKITDAEDYTGLRTAQGAFWEGCGCSGGCRGGRLLHRGLEAEGEDFRALSGGPKPTNHHFISTNKYCVWLAASFRP